MRTRVYLYTEQKKGKWSGLSGSSSGLCTMRLDSVGVHNSYHTCSIYFGGLICRGGQAERVIPIIQPFADGLIAYRYFRAVLCVPSLWSSCTMCRRLVSGRY